MLTRRMADRSTIAHKLLFGAYSPPAPEQGLASIDGLQHRLGRAVSIVLWYQQWHGWGTQVDAAWLTRVAGSGRIPLLTWEPWDPAAGVKQPAFSLSEITDGGYDGYIRSWARELAAYGREVYLRPMHEMNGNWYPWAGEVNGNTAADYVRAWRHMHDIFVGEHATNVKWVFSPYASDVPAGNAFERYYPGSTYVDVLALDGYNWGSGFPQYGGWRSFARIFAPAYERIGRLGHQPIWVAETASAPEGGDKAAWVKQMFASASRFPRLRAIVWFNTDKERDWRATSSSQVADAFSATG